MTSLAHSLERAPQGRESARLWLSRLVVSEFRCYQAAELTADARPVVLTGPNGAGKTNLLEAISFLAPGRGLRGARLSEVDRRRDGLAQGAWTVAADLETPLGARTLGTGRDAASPRDKRLLRVDGQAASSQQALGEVVSIVWLTPIMDRLFQEGPGERRRFLDRLVFGADPAHAGRITGYEQAMRERARLLRGDRGAPDPAWLSALEDTMAGHGVAIAAARCAMVDRLASACAATEGGFPRAGLAVAGTIEAALRDESALAVEEAFRGRLAANREQDAETGGAAEGTHRSDLRVTHLGKGEAAEACSTGEQKALLVAIVLTHARLVAAERGEPPILLLDEVAAHLDDQRRRALFEDLLAMGAQAWLTGTDRALFEGLEGRARFLGVDSARITEE